MNEHSTVGQRFTQLINHLGISKNAFAMSLDKTATVIQHLVEERNKPGFGLICKVFEVYPNVSKDWLLQGTGPMLTGTAELPKQEEQPAQPQPVAAEIAATPVVPAEAVATEAAAPLIPTTPVPAAPAEPAAIPAPVPAPAPEVAGGSPAPAPVMALPPVATPAVAAPAVPDAGAWQTALYTQQMAHQLAMAEMRNQHLQDQQRLMQQMMDLMQRKLM